MIEILGGQLELAFAELGICAIKTYEGNTHLDDKTQIWEVNDEDFNKLCEINDEDWKDNWGWWRGAEGSNVNNPLSRFNINNHYIKAWDGNWFRGKKYSNLLEYMCEEIGSSQPRNVCALAVDLAKINNIKMSELFKKYQG